MYRLVTKENTTSRKGRENADQNKLLVTLLNESLKTGDKALLQKKLLENIECPESINLHEKPSCLIIDGQALVFSLGKAKNCSTFGHLADRFIQSVLFQGRSYDRIDVVFYRYRINSIKENTRNRHTKKTKPS